MASRPVKQVRIAEAREAARQAREIRERRARRRRVLIPLVASTVVVLVVAAVFVAIALQPRSTSSAGPRNMISGGIAFASVDGAAQPTSTAALTAGAKPAPTEWPAGDDRVHLQTYIDWTCPACKAFEAQYSDALLQLVSSGKATLEIFPIAILGHSYSTDYSARAANAAACVADIAPDRFLAAQSAMYSHQAEEGGPGLSTDEILTVLHDAGVRDTKVDACVRSSSFSGWVGEQTDRVTSDATLKTVQDGRLGFSTPTIVADGKVWNRTTSLSAFLGLTG